jgi:hypothetical protein
MADLEKTKLDVDALQQSIELTLLNLQNEFRSTAQDARSLLNKIELLQTKLKRVVSSKEDAEKL